MRLLGALGEAIADRVRRIADGDHRRHRHAALAGGSVRGADDRLGRKAHVGVGHHDRVVLRTAQRLHSLAVCSTGLVDVFRDRRRSDERHRLDAGMHEDRVDRFLVAVNDVEHAGRKTRLGEQLGEAQRRRRVTLRRLQDERVAARDGDGKHPHRNHRREIERRDARAYTDRLAQRVRVDVGADVLAVFALEQMRNAGRELDDFDASRDRALCVGERLAVLLRDDARDVLLVRVQQLAKAHQHARAPKRRRRAPRGKCSSGRLHRRIDVCPVRERHVPNHFAGRRVRHLAVARRLRRHRAATDPQRQPFESRQVHHVLRFFRRWLRRCAGRLVLRPRRAARRSERRGRLRD